MRTAGRQSRRKVPHTVNGHPQVPSTEPALLLVVAHGVGEKALTALRGQNNLPSHQVQMEPSCESATALLTGSADASSLLREQGVAVDRQSLVLRSRTSCDDAAIAALSRRPTGPGHATILELHSVVETAITAGFAAVPAALSALVHRIATAAGRVRSGPPTEVWVLGLGDLQPVTTMFDFQTTWNKSKATPIADELEIQINLGRVIIRARTQVARDIACDVLSSKAFRAFGSIAEAADLQLRFVAARNIAFGRRRVTARPPNHEEANLTALLPRAPRALELALDLRTMIARFWMRAAAHSDLGHTVQPETPPTVHDVTLAVDSAPSLVQDFALMQDNDSALRRR